MLRNCRVFSEKVNTYVKTSMKKRTFLTNKYKCEEAWKVQTSSSILNNVNLSDFYNLIDHNYTSKGVISAIDVDIFANAIKDPLHLDELKDLLHKLRLSAETGNTLVSTHEATIRNYLQFDSIPELITILKDPLNFGIFIDVFTANILLDKLITSSNIEQAANVASLVMLQEDFSNEITNALCQFASYKYIQGYIEPAVPEKVEEKKKKIEEVKIRLKFLRNPYFDDHFDITDIYALSGKTLALTAQSMKEDNLSINLQIIGWLSYKKYDKLLSLCNNINPSFKVYTETIELIKRDSNSVEDSIKSTLDQCISSLSKADIMEEPLEESIKTLIENAINKNQNSDIQKQQELFKSWAELRQIKLDEQTKRLDRAKRVELIEQKQRDLETEEQKLWFFENEDKIDLEIEEKEKLQETSSSKKVESKKIDEDYIPPEIIPKRR